MQKADIWRFLLFALALLALHYGFLWRQLNVDRLRMRLLVLEWRLVELIRSQAAGEEALELDQLRTLIHRLAKTGPDLVYTRIALACILLRGQQPNSCRRALESIASLPVRDKSIEILGLVEEAVSFKLLVGSPLLWLPALYRWARQGSQAGALRLKGLVPAYELLEHTLNEELT